MSIELTDSSARESIRWECALDEGELEGFRHSIHIEPKTRAHTAQRYQLLYAIGSTALLRLDAGALAAPAHSKRLIPRLGCDGAGLAPLLAHLAAVDPDAKARILEAVQRVLPQVLGFRMPRAEITTQIREQLLTSDQSEPRTRLVSRSVWGHLLEVKLQGAGWLLADLLSEGTLLCIGLVAVLFAPIRPRIVLLDDVDRALHPSAQRRLMKVLAEVVQDESTKVQVICTTHSPYLMDAVSPECVRVIRRDESGSVRGARLVDHSDWDRWRGDMHAGEFWSFVGEDWLESGQ